MRNHAEIAAILLLAVLATAMPATPASPAPDVTVEEVMDYLGLSASERARLRAGEIVSAQMPRSKESSELALWVAGIIPGSVEGLYAAVASGETLRLDRNIEQFHEITGWPARAEDFAGIEFTADEQAEVERLLRFDGGSELNLDRAEIERLRTLHSRLGDAPPEAEARKAVSAAYAGFLMERYQAYRERGLAGIAPYVRSRTKQVEPARTLRLAAEAATFFSDNDPALYQAFTDFPKATGDGVEHRFYWFKQRVQDRPAFVLSHQMLTKQPGYAVIASRQYYVGHSFNSVQIVSGAFPVAEGVVVFYTNRTSIDQLAGMTGAIARPIASGRLAERVTARFERLRARAKQ